MFLPIVYENGKKKLATGYRFHHAQETPQPGFNAWGYVLPPNRFVLDVEVKDWAYINTQFTKYNITTNTYTVETKKGYHFYYDCLEPVPLHRNLLATDDTRIEVKSGSSNRYVVCAGSVLNGHTYTVYNPVQPVIVDTSFFNHLLYSKRGDGVQVLTNEVDYYYRTYQIPFWFLPESQTNNTVYRLTCELLDNGYSEAQALDIMQQVNADSGSIWTTNKIATVVANAARYTMGTGAITLANRLPVNDALLAQYEVLTTGHGDVELEPVKEVQEPSLTPLWEPVTQATNTMVLIWKKQDKSNALRPNMVENLKSILLNNNPPAKSPAGNPLAIHWCEFSKRVVIDPSAPWRRGKNPTPFLTDEDLSILFDDISSSATYDYYNFNINTLVEAIHLVAYLHKVSRPVQKIMQLPNPKKYTERDLLPMVFGVKRTAYTEEAGEILMRGIVGRLLLPGLKFDHMLILLSQNEGVGKTLFCQHLAIAPEYFKSLTLETQGRRMTDEMLAGTSIALLDELDGVNARTHKHLKALISKEVDTYRRPFSRNVEDIPRSAVFVGTRNNYDGGFLNGAADNRRYLVLDVSKCNIHTLMTIKNDIYASARNWFFSQWDDKLTKEQNKRKIEQQLYLSAEAQLLQKQAQTPVLLFTDESFYGESVNNGIQSYLSMLEGGLPVPFTFPTSLKLLAKTWLGPDVGGKISSSQYSKLDAVLCQHPKIEKIPPCKVFTYPRYNLIQSVKIEAPIYE